MRSFALSASLMLVAASASVSEAQVRAPYRAQPRFVVFGDAIVSKPKGEFANYVDQGYGFNGGAMIRLDPAGMFGVRAEIGGLQYGRERMPVAFDFSGRLSADVVTTNVIGWIGIGPQFTFPVGPIRPYANAAFAVTNFRTTSAI